MGVVGRGGIARKDFSEKLPLARDEKPGQNFPGSRNASKYGKDRAPAQSGETRDEDGVQWDEMGGGRTGGQGL